MIIDMTVLAFAGSAEKPIGLLIPEPPTTAEQRFVGMAMRSDIRFKKVEEMASRQVACQIDWAGEQPLDLQFRMLERAGDVNPAVFRVFDNPHTHASRDLAMRVRKLAEDSLDLETVERHLCDFIWRKFTYGPKNPALEFPDLLNGIQVGNCIDINTLFLSCLHSAGIECAYMAGYFFTEPGMECVADGMHCWISTRVADRLRHWDIAHCLIAGFELPVEGLNPNGGCRVAFSYGRGLRFSVGGHPTSPISHFAEPHWVFPDLSVQKAMVETRQRAIGPTPEVAMQSSTLITRSDAPSAH